MGGNFPVVSLFQVEPAVFTAFVCFFPVEIPFDGDTFLAEAEHPCCILFAAGAGSQFMLE